MRSITALLLLIISVPLLAQFSSKKEEKFYYKLDDAFLDYDFETILENEEKAKEIFLSREDTVAANVYSFLGELYYYELEEARVALDYYSSELDLREKLQPTEGHSDLKAILASINYDLGYYGKAETLLLAAKNFDEKQYGKSSETYFDTSMGLVDLYLNIEDVEKARDEIKDLEVYVDKETTSYLGVQKSLGDSYAIQGSYKRAEKTYLEALESAAKNGLEISFEYVSTLNSLAILYEDKSKLPEAEACFEEAIQILERLGEDFEDALFGTKGNLARVYFNLGDYEKAIGIQSEVAVFDKEFFGEESFIYGVDLINLGRTYSYAGQYSKGEEAFKEALEVFTKAGDGEPSLDYARAQSQLSELYANNGQTELAIENGLQAVKVFEDILGDKNWETSRPMYNLGNAYMSYDDLEKAENYATRANQIRKKTLGASHPLYARSTKQLAILNWKKGDTKEALKYYKETFKNYFDQINSFFPVLTEEEKATFYYTKLRPGFEQYVSFIEETSLENRELLGEIYDYQLALKGLIMYATSKVRESILASNDEALIAKFELWIAQREQMARLFSATEMDLVSRNKKIDSLTESSNALEEELSKSSQAFGKNFANKRLSWKDIRDVLEPGEAAVEMVRYRNFTTDSAGVFTDEIHYAAMIVRHDTEDHPEMVILRNGALMEKKFLANYRNAIRFKISEDYSYRLFWEPISRRLEGIKKIYFAPDGVYNQISIYTLQNSETKNYLLDEIDLALVTNTKDLLEDAPEFKEGGQSVFFGFPEYSMGASEKTEGEATDRGMGGTRGIRGTRSGREGALSRGASIPRGVRGNLVRYMRSFNGLAMLPGTKKEVELIDSLYANSDKQAEAYFLSEALEGTLKSVDNPNILHIATHGFFLELDPDEKSEDSYAENPLLRSGLILAGANTYIQSGEITAEQNGDDGILTAYEAMNMNLDNTDVVVMSACETGLGEIKNGEGVYGLQRAFQIAGADAIIMSMWTVDDDATQELMTVFYEEWLSHGDKQRAFNSAQKRIRDKYKKPYYWGAFVMIGE
ncbi:MAG: CHAT domain-containing protein [Bacteroidota bacterium]